LRQVFINPSLNILAKNVAVPHPYKDMAFSKNHPLAGITLMVVSCLFMASLSVFVKILGQELHPFQVVFLRNFFSLILILPLVFTLSKKALVDTPFKFHIVRSLNGVLAMTVWFYVIARMPLADSTAISFTTPLFATLGAVLFLKEKVHFRRWAAICMGFSGVLLMMQPSGDGGYIMGLLGLLSAVLMAVSTLLIKSLSKTESARVMLLYMGLFMTPLSFPLAWAHWQPMTTEQLWLSLAMGAVAALAHLFLNKAFALAEVSALQPFDFIRLPIAAMFGYLLFAEIPTLETLLGALIIAGSSIYIAYRESKVKKSAVLS
jgi:drug/metabolite transporter (DMT)-like permease